MSETDIYKSREQAQNTPVDPRFRKGRRRRSANRGPFDEPNRRRRSKNSGFRRFLHLSRKSDNEKYFWRGLLIAIVVILSLVAIWQFLYLEHVARQQSTQDGMYIPIHAQPQTDSAAE